MIPVISFNLPDVIYINCRYNGHAIVFIYDNYDGTFYARDEANGETQINSPADFWAWLRKLV